MAYPTKLRSDSALAELTDAQRDELIDWIDAGSSYKDAAHRAGQPMPDGFSINLHVTTVRRHYCRERARRNTETLAETRANNIISADPDELTNAARTEFANALFNLSTDPDSREAFNSLSRAFHRLELARQRSRGFEIAEQRTQLEQKRLKLETRKFEYDAFLAAAKHAHELVEILDSDKTTDLEKFALAQPVLFSNGNANGAAEKTQTNQPSTSTSHAQTNSN